MLLLCHELPVRQVFLRVQVVSVVECGSAMCRFARNRTGDYDNFTPALFCFLCAGSGCLRRGREHQVDARERKVSEGFPVRRGGFCKVNPPSAARPRPQTHTHTHPAGMHFGRGTNTVYQFLDIG